MQTLISFSNFINELKQSNSRNYKLETLRRYDNDEAIKFYLNFIYNPYITTGISNKKLNKQIDNNYVIISFGSIFEFLNHLERCNTGTDTDIAQCQAMLAGIEDIELRQLLETIITKNVQLGIDAVSINKCIPNLIPTFNVQLANKYFDKPEYVEGKKFTLTTKIDGGRIIAIKKDGDVKFYTRAGQLYEGLVDLEAALKSDIFPDNICFDGEITLLNPGNLTSKDQYKQTMKIVRKDGEKHGVKMRVFDMMLATDFLNQISTQIYDDRRAALENLFAEISCDYFTLLDNLYTGTDTSEIQRVLNEQIANGEEGIMINICDAYYEFKRTNSLLKVKKFKSCDLRIIDMEIGTNKNSDRLGAFICEYKNGNTVKVGSGFSYEQRLEFWTNKDKYIGSIVEVGYFEETSNADGGLSLRFPTFKDIRTDKTEPNF